MLFKNIIIFSLCVIILTLVYQKESLRNEVVIKTYRLETSETKYKSLLSTCEDTNYLDRLEKFNKDINKTDYNITDLSFLFKKVKVFIFLICLFCLYNMFVYIIKLRVRESRFIYILCVYF